MCVTVFSSGHGDKGANKQERKIEKNKIKVKELSNIAFTELSLLSKFSFS